MLPVGRDGFEKVVKEYQAPIRRLFLNLTLGDEMLSDDLAQDTFIKAYTNWNGFRRLSSTKTWLFRIAYNVFYDYRRSLHPTDTLEMNENNNPTSKSTHHSSPIFIRQCNYSPRQRGFA